MFMFFGLDSKTVLDMRVVNNHSLIIKKGGIPFLYNYSIRFFILIFLLLSFYISKGQDVLLLNVETQNPVQYAHVSFLGDQMGTYSDANGKINLLSIKQADSIQITHINYEDTLISYTEIKKTIYLRPNEKMLDEVVIYAKSKTKSSSKKNKKYNYLNVPSLEIGIVFKNNSKWTQSISSFSIPVKGGIDSALVSLNLYAFSNQTNSPTNLLASKKVIIGNKRHTLELTLENPIKLAFGQQIFFSFELLGYLDKGNLHFTKYNKFKDALGYTVVNRQERIVMTRIKNSSPKWFLASLWDVSFETKYQPLIKIMMEKEANKD